MTIYELKRYLEEAESEFGSECEIYFDPEFNEIMVNLGGAVRGTIVELPMEDEE